MKLTPWQRELYIDIALYWAKKKREKDSSNSIENFQE